MNLPSRTISPQVIALKTPEAARAEIFGPVVNQLDSARKNFQCSIGISADGIKYPDHIVRIHPTKSHL